MARSEARIKTAIWNDDDFRQLTAPAQWLYMLALSQPNVSLCGVVPYTPRRWAQLSKGTATDEIRMAVAECENARYVVVDEVTEEVLIRTFIRHDRVLEKPNVLVGMTRDFASIQSQQLRNALFDELGERFFEGLQDGLRERLAEPFVKAFHERFPGHSGKTVENTRFSTSDGVQKGFVNPSENGSRAHARGATIHHPPSTILPPKSNPSPKGFEDEDLKFRFDKPDDTIESVLELLADRWMKRNCLSEDGNERRRLRENAIEAERDGYLSRLIGLRLTHPKEDAEQLLERITVGDAATPKETRIGEAMFVLAQQDLERAQDDPGYPIRDPQAWFTAAVKKRREKHHGQCEAIFQDNPGIDVAGLVVELGGINPDDPDGTKRADFQKAAEIYKSSMREEAGFDRLAGMNAMQSIRANMNGKADDDGE